MEKDWVEDSFHNVDHHANTCHDFILKKGDFDEFLRLRSSNSGISICVKGHNNGYIPLDEEMVRKLIGALLEVVPKSAAYRNRSISYWNTKNAQYDELKKMMEEKE